MSRAFAHFLALSNAAESGSPPAQALEKSRGRAGYGGVDCVGRNRCNPESEDGAPQRLSWKLSVPKRLRLFLPHTPPRCIAAHYLLTPARHGSCCSAMRWRARLCLLLRFAQTNEILEREVSAMWGSDEIRRSKPTPRAGGQGRSRSHRNELVARCARVPAQPTPHCRKSLRPRRPPACGRVHNSFFQLDGRRPGTAIRTSRATSRGAFCASTGAARLSFW